jgi:hypothetical protein
MESTVSKTGLDNRHRNKDGEISGKHGNTLVRTMGEIFVADVAPGEARRAPQLDVFNQVLRDRHFDLSMMRCWAATSSAVGTEGRSCISNQTEDKP